jgi:hypothetical protein
MDANAITKWGAQVLRTQTEALQDSNCRLSLRESTPFRGAKGDDVGNLLLYDA